MEISLIDIKQSYIIEFYQEAKSNGIISEYYGARQQEPIIGLLEGDFFLDINTYNIYPIAYISPSSSLVESPVLDMPYACSIESYIPLNLKEKTEIIEKAKRAHEWYKMLEENKEKVICFQKIKYEKQKRRFN